MPEALFAVDGIVTEHDHVRAEMLTGPWSASAGSLGVLADNVLGYSLIAAAPEAMWSVSAEISLDFCAPLPEQGTKLTAEGRAVHVDTARGLGEGSVVDPDGRLIARTRQWGRFVDRTPQPAHADAAERLAADGVRANGLVSVLGERVVRGEGSAELVFDVSDMLVNPINSLHGGITLWLAELTASCAVASMADAPSELVPTSLTVTYLRPLVLHDAAVFRAEVVNRGRSLALTRVTATNRAGKPCAVASVHHHRPG